MVKAFRCTCGWRCFKPRISSRKKFEGQIGVQAADNVNLRGAFAHALCGALVHFFQRIGVCAGGIRIAAKGAELAMSHANVGGIDVAIHVVIGDVAVALFADVIGQPADRQQVWSFVQSDAVVEGTGARRRRPCRRWVLSCCVSDC